MRKFVVSGFVAAALFAATGSGGALAQSRDEFDAYAHGGELGQDLFGRAYAQSVKVWRVATALRVCNYKGLAEAVEKKDKDPGFDNLLRQMLAEDRAASSRITYSSMLHAKQTAIALKVGFRIGYEDGMKLLPPDLRAGFCEVIVGEANELMK